MIELILQVLVNGELPSNWIRMQRRTTRKDNFLDGKFVTMSNRSSNIFKCISNSNVAIIDNISYFVINIPNFSIFIRRLFEFFFFSSKKKKSKGILPANWWNFLLRESNCSKAFAKILNLSKNILRQLSVILFYKILFNSLKTHYSVNNSLFSSMSVIPRNSRLHILCFQIFFLLMLFRDNIKR